MSNSTTLLDTISSSQASKEVTANALFDAGSPATLFGRRASTSAALTWGYYGGAMWVDGVLTAIANGTVALSASTTNYVEATRAGAVSKNTTAFTPGRIPLYTIVTGTATVTSYTDHRLANTPLTGRLALSVAGGANVTLTSAQAANNLLRFSGLLTGNINVVVPDGPQEWDVWNDTTGAYTLTVKTSAGTGIAVTQGKSIRLAADGTNVVVAGNDYTSMGLGSAATATLDTDGTMAADSDTRVPSQKAVRTYVATAVTGLLDFKGATDCSTNPNYPAASKGDAYLVSVAGKIGGASGKTVAAGDTYIASADNAGGTEASVGTSWFVLETNLDTNNIDINGGAIDGTVIGGSSPAAVTATALTCTNNATLGDAEATDTHAIKGATTLLANSASAAFTVTQNGSGLAFVVEDSATPDATPVAITSVGALVIGNAAAITVGSSAIGVQIVYQGSAVANFSQVRYSADANSSGMYVGKSRATVPGTNTIVQSGDTLGSWRVYGDDGAAFIEAAKIDAVCDGTPGTNDMPGRLAFFTTADGASSPTERLRIDSTGALIHRANATTVVDASSHLGLRSYTVATLPSAGTAGRLIYVSDGTTNKRLAVSDGTNWRWPDGAVVS